MVVDGGGTAGAFYGRRTILQMVRLDPHHASVPRGVARDVPNYRERGVMLDPARKFYSLAYIERTIKQLAWLKMNTLHLHLTSSKELASRYHVRIQAELELPTHASQPTSYNLSLRWPCASMNDTPYGSNDGFTVDTYQLAVRPLTSPTAGVAPAGGTVAVTWQLDVPADATPGEHHLVAHAMYAADAGASHGVVVTSDLVAIGLPAGGPSQ